MTPKQQDLFVITTVDVPREPHSRYKVSEALDLIGPGRVQKLAVLGALVCLLHFMVDVIGNGMVMPLATCELQLDTMRKGVLLGAPFLGTILTTQIWGYVADEKGRQWTVLWSQGASMAFSVAAALSPSYWLMVFLRFCVGLVSAGTTTTMYIYVGELMTTNTKAKYMSWIGSACAYAYFLLSGVGYLFNHYGTALPVTATYTIDPWRQQIIVLCIPGMIGSLIFYWLPESPKFLNTKGRSAEAIEKLRFIHEKNGNEAEKFPIKELQSEGELNKATKTLLSSLASFASETRVLFRKPFVWPMLGLILIQYGLFTVGAAFSVWYPEITNRLVGGSKGVKICDILSVPKNVSSSQIHDWSDCHVEVQDKMFEDALVLGVVYIVTYIIIGSLARRIKVLYIISMAMVISAASGFLLPLLSNEVAIVMAFSLLIVGCGSAIPIVNMLFVDIFPVFTSGMAIAVSVLSGRIGSLVGSNTFGVLLENYCEPVIFGVSGLLAVGVVILFLLPRRVIGEQVQH